MRGTTWKPGCPVPMSDLRLLEFNYLGFDGDVKRGQMVVNASVAENVLWVFRQLFEARFPLRKVALAREYKPKHDKPSQHRSVTAAFNCRPAITLSGPTGHFSQHAYGLAVDVNPRQNPEVGLNGQIRDKSAKIYRDRSRHLEGMIHPGDIVVRSFAAIGWKWGGDWHSFKDYMHFSLTGT
jgi:D-alanyl-D-alanine carboxypeptidase